MRNRRRIVILYLVVLAGLFYSVGSAAGDVNTEVWSRLYNRAQSLDQQYVIMQSIVERHDSEMAPVLQQALADLNDETKSVKGTTNISMQNQLMKLIVKELGNLRALEAAGDVYTTMKDADDPFLKGEALIALGRMRAVEYADDIGLMLRNINFFPSSEARRDEILAYSCVLALGRLRDEAGYRPVFFASIGWYSPVSGVKEAAAEALNMITDNPVPMLVEIITTDSSFIEKQAALEAGLRSPASEEDRIVLAATSLEEALRHVGKNVTQKAQLGKIRVTAMNALLSLEAKNTEAVPSLEQLLYMNYDINEKLTAIGTLGVNGSDEAVRALSKYLKFHNERMAAGINPDDYRPVRATIEALGTTRNPLAAEELMAVEISGWTNAIIRAAREALDLLNN